MVCFIWCSVHYGKYLDAFDPKGRAITELDWMTYTEDKEDLALTEEEKTKDEAVRKQELEFLNTLGTRTSQQKFNEAIALIRKSAIEETQKIYVGEDAKWLVGAEKIPEYLSTYLKTFMKNAEEFRINSIRYMRTVCLELVEHCQRIPETIFGDITNRFTREVIGQVSKVEKDFNSKHSETSGIQRENLRKLRPGLANPSNKEYLEALNKEEKAWYEIHIDMIDETQLQLVDIEMLKS